MWPFKKRETVKVLVTVYNGIELHNAYWQDYQLMYKDWNLSLVILNPDGTVQYWSSWRWRFLNPHRPTSEAVQPNRFHLLSPARSLVEITK